MFIVQKSKDDHEQSVLTRIGFFKKISKSPIFDLRFVEKSRR